MGIYLLLLCLHFSIYVHLSNGCTINEVTQWFEPQHFWMQDTHRGVIITQTTANIEGIQVTFGDGLNRGPYLSVTHINSVLTVSTTDAFAEYEEYETLLSIRFTILFSCVGGTTRPLTYVFNINDTNNHAPVFMPSDSFEFSLALPVPPGFKVSGCDYLIVRDIDLTTYRIDFDIQDNPNFEIVYYGQIQPKVFGAYITTKTLIRSLPDSLSLEIHATDVDATKDDPLTSTAVVNIIADNAFRLPDPLFFSAAFYEADYTDDNDLILRNGYISLQEGYDDQVRFEVQGEYSQYFDLVDNNNRLSFVVKSPLPEDISESQILLVVVAEREFTNSASATVVVHLPKEVELRFELPLYKGQIEDNILTVPKLTLVQGYEETLSISIINEYASYFSSSREGNIITLSMQPLPASVIQNNNVLSIQVVAYTNRNVSSSAVVVLEIIKDDYTTPIFGKSMYNGTYDAENGLILEPIILVQGFDDTVLISLTGDHASYFDKVEQNPEIRLTASIPPEIWSDGNILISVVATKPRTVGANTAVLISLPSARKLTFEVPSYRGSLENNKVYIENILLKYGYTSDVEFILSGEFHSYFIANNTENEVTISLQSAIPESILFDHNALMLSLTASGLNAITATTNILLDVIKDDHVTPVFEKTIYNGIYDAMMGLDLEQILIIQGYDETVDVKLDGDQAHLFTPKQEGPTITLSGTVPAEIWPEQILILTLTATKPRTVGANTVIQINLPSARELNFEQSTYTGTFRDNTVTIEEIVLSVGYSSDVKFEITGQHSDFFTLSNEVNKLSISFNASLSEELTLENNLIVLTIRASGLNAITTFTTILLEVLKDDSMTPVFTQHIYRGIYMNASHFDVEEINLVQGYDETVSFSIDGDHTQYFQMDVDENNVKINLKSEIPKDLIFEEKFLLLKVSAEKDLTVGATAVVSIQFPTDLTEPTRMSFSQITYLGSLNDDKFEVSESIILETGFGPDTKFNLYGDYVEYFELASSSNVITIKMVRALTADELRDMEFIVLQIEAKRERAVTATAALIIDIVRPDAVVFPIFEKSYYTGTFGLEDGLRFEEEMRLAVGFDETVTFSLEGDYSHWFALKYISPNNVGLSLNGEELPQDISQNHLVFSIVATKENDLTGRSAIVLSRKDRSLRFTHGHYKGYIEKGVLSLDVITLEKGYSVDVEFTLKGDYIDYFQTTNEDGYITVKLVSDLPTEIEERYNILILTLEARVNSLTTHTTLILEIIKPTVNNTDHVIEFENTYYTGSYSETSGLMFHSVISVLDRLQGPIQFNFEGENSIWFGLEARSENSVSITIKSPIPPTVLANNRKLIFVVTAARPESVMARATVIISLTGEYTTSFILAFEQLSYTGSVDYDNVHLEPIVLREGFTEDVSFSLLGDLARYFNHDSNGPVVSISLRNTIPEESIPSNRVILLKLQASAAQATPAFATIVMVVNGTEDIPATEQPAFRATYYTGLFTEKDGLNFDQLISLSHGYDSSVVFDLVGVMSVWFGLERRSENSLAVILTSTIPPAVLVNNRKLIFVVTAVRPESVMARATVIISLTDEYTTSTVLAFEQISYTGSVANDKIHLEPIVLREGFTEHVSFTLLGDLARYFNHDSNGPVVTISLRNTIPAGSIPSNRVILLKLQASAAQATPAFATIVMVVNGTEDIPATEQPSFRETYYTGVFTEKNGLIFDRLISLSHGYDGNVVFDLVGDNSVWFGLERRSENSLVVILTSTIPPAVLVNNRELIFVVTAARRESVMARATVIISLTDGESTVPNITFDKILYNGVIRLGNVVHETITITGYTGKNIEILGQHAELFEASLSTGVVVINLRPSAILPNVSHIALELQVGGAGAVLVLHILEPDTPVPPTVTFGSASYVLRADVTHTGSIGQVQATSDNGEAIRYSLVIDEAHLRERLSISNDGELRLTAPANTGMYSFQVVATTAITQASATVPVHLSIEVVTVCGDDIVVPPLIILERDEEEPHRNLVVYNSTFGGCEFTLTNIWPEGQSWLYVDADGLHSTAIDREHESIAFMAVSQIQVELILGCEGDVSSRTKRSLRSKSTDRLRPYEYGSNKWILTDSIRYNARRSLVNLIVNDINDNVPKFVGKENEPIVSIVVGYPVPSLEAIILPTALVELKATDADIGENAALVYWSTDESLAVSPTTGFVHVRTSSNLQNNARFTVHATDQNGAGHTGSLEVTVKLLEINRIGVFSIRNAFLEDEQQILGNLSKTAGYDVKALRTVVISESIISRDMMRASSNELTATLQLFVYGLIEQEPVEITQLIADINNAPVTVNVANVLSLEDHLKGTEICVLPGRDNGLLAATIALSVLIFILILAFAVWYFLKWRKNINYDQFSDRNSMASRNVSIEELKSEINAKPRLNIEELKKSERKLKKRLDTPVTDDSAKPSVSREQPMESIINISTPDPQMPIIIQTIDKLKYNAEESEDDDEFGEKMKSRRKSVVTFNENVEKIIHVEENPNNNDDDDYEVFKL